MHVLLLRPHPGNDRFGLGPFFHVEPLGLAYLAAALRGAGIGSTIVDLRFGALAPAMRRARPGLVGISCIHALEYDRALETARAVKRLAPRARVVVGGHAAAAFPQALEDDAVDAVCLGDGEEAIVRVARGEPLDTIPGLRVRGRATPAPRVELDRVPLPLRDSLERVRGRYRCLQHRPVWLVETARGCPFRCSFCAVWSFNGRTFRERAVEHVARDVAACGDRVFVVDDLFFHTPARSLELAHALARRGVRKRWLLVQSRADVLRRHPELLRAWRALAERLDVFVGFEAASDEELATLSKDASTADTDAALELTRSLGVGVTGNFVVDPDWEERDFKRLWDFVETRKLGRAGYTILTPLPGTELYTRLAPRIRPQPWARFDMHHLLWEPRLGARRFFELYAETWRRSVLNLGGERALGKWLGKTSLRDAFALARVLARTQRMMRASAYLAEH